MIEAGLSGGTRHADDAAGGTGQDRVLAPEDRGVSEAAIRLHEQEPPGSTEPSDHTIDVAAQDRRQIGVDDAGIAAADELDQRLDLVAGGYLGEADPPRDRNERSLMIGPAPAVNQDDRNRAIATVEGILQPALRGEPVERHNDGSVRHHPLVHLDDRTIERLGEDNVPGEDIGPGLRPDPQRVTEARGDREDDVLSLAFEQGIGGDGRPHLDRLDDAPSPFLQNLADPRDRGVVIAPGIFGKELSDEHPTVGRAGDDVGEGAAAVDREIPAAGAHSPSGSTGAQAGKASPEPTAALRLSSGHA